MNMRGINVSVNDRNTRADVDVVDGAGGLWVVGLTRPAETMPWVPDRGYRIGNRQGTCRWYPIKRGTPRWNDITTAALAAMQMPVRPTVG